MLVDFGIAVERAGRPGRLVENQAVEVQAHDEIVAVFGAGQIDDRPAANRVQNQI